jgi:hypothetical protein
MKRATKPQPLVHILVGLMLLAMGLANLHRNLDPAVCLGETIVGAVLLTTGAVLVGVRQVVRQVLREELNPPPKEKVLNLD